MPVPAGGVAAPVVAAPARFLASAGPAAVAVPGFSMMQEHVRERFVHRVGVMALTVVLYVNLTGGAIGGVLYGFGPLSSVLIGAALAGLPLVGLLALNRRAQRHERAARETIAWLLGSRVESGWPTRLARLWMQ